MPPFKYKSLHNQCEQCGLYYNLLVHHIDEDRSNNSVANLMVLCTSCHAIVHKRITNIKKMRHLYITDYNQLTFEFYRRGEIK